MATALQQQLAVIAANSTHQLDLKAQKAAHSKSLLFEPRQAASQNFDTIYQICIEGFDELCQLDNRFIPFSRTLFSEQSKAEDRTRMTAKENQELDDIIERFLGLLASKLLLSPAVKAAEWLVRRFRTHEYNTTLMLFAFLPYHSAQIFTTLLSIVPEQLPSTFRFLHPYRASIQALPRHAVVTAIGGSSALLTTFSHFVLGVVRGGHHSAVLLGFWASTTAQAINMMVDSTRLGRESIRLQREEDMLLKVLPVLQSALNCRGSPELYIACCMIITILVTRASLQEKVLDAMMEEVVLGWSESTIEDGMTCLAIICEEKERVAIPKRIAHVLVHLPDLLAILTRVSEKCRVESLMIALARSVLSNITEQRVSPLLQLILEFEGVSDNGLKMIYQLAAETARTSSDKETLTESKREIIRLLEVYSSESSRPDLVRQAIREAKAEALRQGQHLEISEEETSRRSESPSPGEIAEAPSTEEQSAMLDISELPDLIDGGRSFLGPNMDSIFTPYAVHFKQAVDANYDIASFLRRVSIFEHPSAERLECLTFLARLWCTESDKAIRVKALKIAADQLKSFSSARDGFTDFQALIPYIIEALSDSSRSVRKAAIKLCDSLRSFFHPSSPDKSRTPEQATWGHGVMYGEQSANMQWLTRDEVRNLLDENLAPVFDDCLLDETRVLKTLAEVMNNMKGSKSKRKSLDTNLQSNLASFIASHLTLTPVTTVRLRLIQIVRAAGKAATAARLETIIPFVRATLEQSNAGSDPSIHVSDQKALLSAISHRTTDEVQLLRSLADGTLLSTHDTQKIAFGRLEVIWPDMKETLQVDVVDWLLSLALTPSLDDFVSGEAVAMIRELSLSTVVLDHLLKTLPKAAEFQDSPPSAKKQRLNKPTESPKLGKIDDHKVRCALRRITLVLELVDESKPEQHPLIMKPLFIMLTEIHHFKALTNSELVYMQGLVLNSLLAIINGLESSALEEVDRTVIRVDLIVESARTTAGTPVHHTALLLMSALASRFPSLVLHSVMPLFTFMSSSIMKQSDEYSARVTERAVASIIPPLAASLKKRGKDLVSGSSELLLSFVAAFEHIPLHRRSSLFRHLIQTLGPKESLFAIAAMLIERYPDDPRAIPFVQELMSGYATVIQMQTIKRYIQLVFDTTKTKRDLADAVLGFNDKTADEATLSTVHLLHGLASVLSGGSLRRKLQKELKAGDDTVHDIRSVYTEVLELGMEFKLRLGGDSELHGGADRVLGALLGLMPTKDFIESSAMLMQSGTDEIRQQVFRSLESRVSQAGQQSSQSKVFIDVLPNCAVFLVPSQPEATRYAAITCIDEISERFGKTDRTAVFQAAEHVAGEAALGSASKDLRVISLLCLASMVEVLEDQIVPILPKSLGTAIGYLESQVLAKQSHADEALVNATYGFASAVLDYVPWVLSGNYLHRLIRISEEILVHELLETDVLARFCALVARKVPIKECLTAILQDSSLLAQSHAPAAMLRLTMLGDVIRQHTKAEIGQNVQLVFQILLTAFDFRRTARASPHDEDLESLNDEIDSFTDAANAVAMDVVLKSNDATFRPFFIRLVDWASSGLRKNEQHAILYRSQSLYSFANTFFAQLKSLVTSYSSLLLHNASSLLHKLHPTEPLEFTLLLLILQTLTNSFTHDQDGFWQSPAHFDAIAPPLLHLLSSSSSLPLTDATIAALTELAACCSSPDHYKSLNTALIAHMRGPLPSSRLAAVKCQQAISARLNLDWIALLPEMLPTISELQEDDDPDVERETLRWVAQIEGITGESMEGMLQ